MSLTTRLERAALRRTLALPSRVLRRLVGPAVTSPDGATLELEAQLLLRLVSLTGRREVHEVGVAAARREMERSVKIVDYRIRTRATDRTIPGPDAGRRIPVRIYEPLARRARRPVLVYLHGGGWALGSIASHEGVCRALATKADAIVVSVDYRLAPEHKFPAAVDDAVAATRWALAEAASLGGDPRRVAVGGDSAGGNLAALVALATRTDALRPMFQLLVYPATDLTRSHRSHALFGDGFMLTRRGMDWFLASYLNDEGEQRDPRASPLFAADLRGLPPALVITAGFDPLRDEGQAYARRMREAGVDAEELCVEGAIHGFFSCGGVFRHAARAVDRAARGLAVAFAVR